MAFNVIGTGTENGISYIDIQAVGTTTAGSSGIRFEATNQVVASSGQSWTGSFYVRQVAGATTNITTINTNVFGRTAANAANADNASNPNFLSTISQASLSVARRSFSLTLADATTAFVSTQLLFTHSIGVAIDITLRIGLPQLEQGAFATSVIPTTTTALTRSEDRASINTMSPWYNASASTIYAEHFRPLPTPAGTFPRAVDFVSTATSDKLGINQLDNRPTVSSQNLYPSGLSWPFTSVAADANNVIKHAIAATVGSGRYAVNGTLGGSDYAIASIPALDQVVIGSGKGFLFNSTLNGWVRRITYYPRRLSNAELVSITSP
jgi:hypothetical protein